MVHIRDFGFVIGGQEKDCLNLNEVESWKVIFIKHYFGLLFNCVLDRFEISGI